MTLKHIDIENKFSCHIIVLKIMLLQYR